MWVRTHIVRKIQALIARLQMHAATSTCLHPQTCIDHRMEKFSRHKRSVFYFAGDFNLNLLDYETNSKVKNFFNLMFSFNLIPVINKVTRVTKTSVTAIDHIITNSYLNTYIQTGIIKTDISDHFPIFLVTNTATIYKRFINNETIQYFRTLLNNVTWEEVENTDCPEKAYNTFLDKFQVIYDQAFPKTKIK